MPRAVMSHFWTAMTDGKRKSFKTACVYGGAFLRFSFTGYSVMEQDGTPTDKTIQALKACHMMKL